MPFDLHGDLTMVKKSTQIHSTIPADLSLVSPFLKDFYGSVTAKKTC